MHWACGQGDLEAVQSCLKSNFHYVDDLDPYYNTPLMWAVWSENVDIISELLAAGANPVHPNSLNVTPLSLATERGLEGIVEMLIKAQNNRKDKTISSPPAKVSIKDSEEKVAIKDDAKHSNQLVQLVEILTTNYPNEGPPFKLSSLRHDVVLLKVSEEGIPFFETTDSQGRPKIFHTASACATHVYGVPKSGSIFFQLILVDSLK